MSCCSPEPDRQIFTEALFQEREPLFEGDAPPPTILTVRNTGISVISAAKYGTLGHDPLKCDG